MLDVLSRIKQKQQAKRFDQLVRPHVEHLYHLAFRLTASQHSAEDLVQDLLTKLYPKIGELEKVEKLRPWLAASLTNLFIDCRRRFIRSPITYTDDHAALDELLYDPRQSPDVILDVEQQISHVQLAFDRLIDEHRIVLTLHDIEGYSLPELAEILDVPIGTVKSRIFRARNRLQFILNDLQNGEPLTLAQRVNE